MRAGAVDRGGEQRSLAAMVWVVECSILSRTRKPERDIVIIVDDEALPVVAGIDTIPVASRASLAEDLAAVASVVAALVGEDGDFAVAGILGVADLYIYQLVTPWTRPLLDLTCPPCFRNSVEARVVTA